jgi:hypothetical protein
MVPSVALALFLILAPISFTVSGIEPSYTFAQQVWDPPDPWRVAQYAANPALLVKDAAAMAFPNVVGKIESEIGGILGGMLLSLGSFVTWLGGMIFDASVDKFVVQFGSLVREEALESALTRSWTTVRDICNLAFIFGFIYIGIMTIISPDSASMKRFLAKIIIGALLINFSLYITQVVIDFTNFTAVKVYDAIVPPNITQGGKPLTISRAIGNYLGVNGLFSKIEPEVLEQMNSDGSFAYYFAATAFLIVTGFTLAMGGLHLLIRFVELLLIMIFSPIFFAAMVFPQTASYANKVKHKLLSASFYAPAYMLLLYLSLSIANALVKPLPEGVTLISVITGTTKGANINTATGPVGAFSVVINFIIIIFLMIAALKLAKTMSVYGGQMAISLGNSARKGTQGYLGRSAVRTVNWASKGVGIGSLENAEKYRQQLRGSDKWYARAGGKVFGATAGVAATRAVGAKFGSSQSVTDVDKENKGYKKVAEENTWIEETKKKINSGNPAQLERTVIDSTEAQTAALLKAFEKNEAVYKQILTSVPNSRLDKLLDEKSEYLSEEKKELLKARRETAIEEKLVREENARRVAEAARTGTTAIQVAKVDDDKRMVAKALVSDLEARGFEFVEKYAGYLTATQIEDMKKSKKFVESELRQLEAARTAYFEGLLNTANPTRNLDIQNEIKARKPKDVAKLPKEFLTDAVTAPHLTVDTLNAVINDQSIEYGVQDTIIKNVRASLATAGTPDPAVNAFVNVNQRTLSRFP